MLLAAGINALDKESDRETESRGLSEVLDVVVPEGGIALDYVIVWDNMFTPAWHITHGTSKGLILLLPVTKNLRKSHTNYIVSVEATSER